MLFLLFGLGLVLAQLTRKLTDHFVDRCIKISIMILAVNVRTGDCKMHLHAEGLFRILIFVMQQNDVSCDDVIVEGFEVGNFFGHKRMDCRRKFKVPWTKMYLHVVN